MALDYCSIRTRRKAMAAIALTAILSVLATYGVLLAINPTLSMWGAPPDQFTPNFASGNVTADEHWEKAQYHHVQYVSPFNLSAIFDFVSSGNITDFFGNFTAGAEYFDQVGFNYNASNTPYGNKIAYAHYYFNLSDNGLDMLIDQCYLTVASKPIEFVWVALDTDGSQDIITSFLDLSVNDDNLYSDVMGNGHDWLFINVTSAKAVRNVNFFGIDSLDNAINATIYGDDINVSVGSGVTPNAAYNHRTIKVHIPANKLTYEKAGATYAMNSETFGASFLQVATNSTFTTALPELITLSPLSLPFTESMFFLSGTKVDRATYL